MTPEKAIAVALEPIIEDVVALEKRVDAIVEKVVLTPPKGDKGEPGRDADPMAVAVLLSTNHVFAAAVKGKDGIHGIDGAGIDAPIWIPGEVYRQGVTVQANLGQHFRALRDTAAPTDDGKHWQRVGTAGFRHCGNFDPDATYTEGDLFIKDFGTFAIVNGAALLLAGRGSVGKRGEPGARGLPGENGTDGAQIIGAQVQGFKLVLVQRCGDGSIDHIEADFTPAIRVLIRDALDELRAELPA